MTNSYPEVYLHRTCRACASPLQEVLNLGPLRLNAFPTHQWEIEQIHRIPLILTVCEGCGLVQLDRTVPPDWLYRHYWYKSGVNEAMVAELRGIVEEAVGLVPVGSGDVVMDIGANDGTLLDTYQTIGRSPERVAVEPALNLTETLSGHAETLIPQYFPHPMLLECYWGRVNILTAIAMAYDVEDPKAFFQTLHDLLAPGGLAVVQFQDFGQQLECAAFDNICLPPDERLLTPQGLRPIADLREGDCVLSDDGLYHGVRHTFSRYYEGEIVELTAYGFGHTLRVTPNHPVYVYRDDRWVWTPAADVQHGDVVGRPILQLTDALSEVPCYVGDGRRTPELQMLRVADLVTLFGYYLAEGSISTNNDVNFYFGPDETDLAEDCRRRIAALGFAARIDESPTSLYVQAHGPISRVLQAQCGRGAAGKHLSPLLLSLPQDLSEELLHAYVRGDGYVYRGSYLRASTVSEQLALDVALLANRVGWKASINEQDRPATCVIEGRTVSQLPLWDILIHTDPQLRQKVWLEDGFQCGRIRKKETTPYAGMVHNIEVEGAGTYVHPAMTVHNCHEHLEYYTLWSLSHIFRQTGLTVERAQHTPINGGSLRLHLRREEDGIRPEPSVAQQLLREAQQGLDTPGIRAGTLDVFQTFRRRVERAKTHIGSALETARDQGCVIDVYGASTKGNILLQVLGVGPEQVRQAIDRSPDKTGQRTITGIPIVGEEEGRRAPADLWLVPIWQFRVSVLQREAWFLEQGGTMLFPLPYCEIVKHEWSSVDTKD